MNQTKKKNILFKTLTLAMLLLTPVFGSAQNESGHPQHLSGSANSLLHLDSIGSSSDIPIPHTIVFEKQSLPSFALKTNLLYSLTASLNLAAEFRLSDKYTLDIAAGYNPWEFSRTRMFKHLMIQPELRYWINEPFNKHFLGFHAIYSHYNIGGFHIGSLKDYRYQGNLYGAGLSYGYQWYLAPRWSLEATLGFGYVYLDYVSQDCESCPQGKGLKDNYRHYIGPTKVGISLIYHIK